MRIKDIGLKILVITAMNIIVMGTFASTPAHAASTCNSGRVCLYGVDGNVQNVDPADVDGCSYGMERMSDVKEVRNRTNRAYTFYWSKNQFIPWLDREDYIVATLAVNQSITFNANSTYYYCVKGF